MLIDLRALVNVRRRMRHRSGGTGDVGDVVLLERVQPDRFGALDLAGMPMQMVGDGALQRIEEPAVAAEIVKVVGDR